MTATFIICPAGLVTGGPELLHQLSSTLQGIGSRSHIIYFPFNTKHTVPESYKKYEVSQAHRDDIKAGDNVVLPEVYTHLVEQFPTNRVFLWWLSVDNFHSSRASTRMAALFPTSARPIAQALTRNVSAIRKTLSLLGRVGGIKHIKKVHLHLHQSEYARTFLEQHRLGPTAPLGDYINEDYLGFDTTKSSLFRENFIAYNPAKGADRTAAILSELAAMNIDAVAMPIKGYSREGVRDLLSRSKVYIDFGNHPGKDRIPREAAAMGACVIVNRRGSAGNFQDVPLSDAYKVDDQSPGFAQDAATKIQAVLGNFEFHSQQFNAYRGIIAEERQQFVTQVQKLFA